MKLTILRNTLYKGERIVADQVVDMPDEDAKKFCEAELAVPVFAEDLEKVGFELDPESFCDENGQPIEAEGEEQPEAQEETEEQPEAPAAKKKAGKKGK